MKFNKLNETIPYVTGGKQKVLTMSPYPGITLGMPGRHADDTVPAGGDFVVMVNDPKMGWVTHQFTHTDLFIDIEWKALDLPDHAAELMDCYLSIVKLGVDPLKYSYELTSVAGMNPQTFLYAVQCLAVAEHRRYAKYEAQFGGRYLPFRFAAGIVEGLWTAADAAERQRRGRPGVEWLERDFGMPTLTKELLNAG